MFFKKYFSADIVVLSQGSFSPGQTFVLDEYCARYGVRNCHRQLCYMNGTLSSVHVSFKFCEEIRNPNRTNGHDAQTLPKRLNTQLP